jgi:anti-sigma regulatory factor (Ser/Thr protein kinase)
VEHGYRGAVGWVEIELTIDERTVTVVVRDYGAAGFATHSQARRPGLTLMESLANQLEVEGRPGIGTTVRMGFTLPSSP